MRVFFLLWCVFYACSNDPQEVKEFIETQNLPVEEIIEAEILHTEHGNLRLKIIANTIKRFEEIQPQLVFSNGVQVVFYNDSGVVESVLEAVHAEVDDINNIMIASENVILTSSEGKRLETEELIWEEKENKIHTDKKVVITTDKEIVKGAGFESTPDFMKYSIANIQGTFNFETTAN